MSDPDRLVFEEMRDRVDEAAAALLATARHNIFRPYTRQELEAMAGLPRYRDGITGSHVGLAFNQLEDEGKCWTDKKLRVCFYPREWDNEVLSARSSGEEGAP